MLYIGGLPATMFSRTKAQLSGILRLAPPGTGKSVEATIMVDGYLAGE
jgi:SpoVK/Ycf46/Vps4 family AAA+-type ATPase